MSTGKGLPYPRLLLVGSALGGGGAETRLRLIAQHVFGGTADVAVLRDEGEVVLGPGQRLFALGFAGNRTYPGVLKRLRRVIDETSYDAVVSFGLYPNTLTWAALRAMPARPALVMTEITRPDLEGRLGGRLRHAISHLVRRISYPAADLCGANSIDGVAEVVRHYRVDPVRIRRLPNVVQPEVLERLAGNVGSVAVPSPPTLCAVARLDPLKRIDTLLQAVAMLPPQLAWRVEILGDGPDREALGTLATRLGIADRVVFHGWTRNPYPVVKRAAAVVLTSTYEGFSNTVIEAMAIGTPVVTSFCSSDAHDMVDRGAALGFPVGDSAALAGHLMHLLTDAECRRGLRDSALRYVADHELEQAVPVYEQLMYDAIARRQERGQIAPLDPARR